MSDGNNSHSATPLPAAQNSGSRLQSLSLVLGLLKVGPPLILILMVIAASFNSGK